MTPVANGSYQMPWVFGKWYSPQGLPTLAGAPRPASRGGRQMKIEMGMGTGGGVHDPGGFSREA